MADETGRMSEEDKFLGVKNTIGSPEAASDPGQEELFGEIEVEVVDDRPVGDRGSLDVEPELQQYSKAVQKRIKKATAKFHGERRAKETAERMSSEAVRHARGLQGENQRLLKLVQQSQNALTEYSKYGADTALVMAQEKFKQAHESGDAEEIAATQQALTSAQLAQASAPSASQRVTEVWKQEVLAEQREAQRNQPHVEEPPPEPDPRAVEWQENNSWFGPDEEMTSFAYGVHEKLVKREGIDPSSEEYYELIDKRMKEVFPTHFSGNTTHSDNSVVVETATRRKASPVVAPASRNNGASPRKVVLSKTQVELAPRLGLTVEQYAQQLLKEMPNG